MLGSQPYSVSSPRGVCALTGRALQAGEPCVSILVEHEDDRLERLDIAAEAWDAGDRLPDARRVVGFWRTVIPDKDRPRQQLVGDDEVLDLFEQLGEATDPKQLAFRSLLCLILIRRRLLVWEGATPSVGGQPGVIRVRRRGEKDAPPIEVIDPGLDDESIESALQQLSAVMNLDPSVS